MTEEDKKEKSGQAPETEKKETGTEGQPADAAKSCPEEVKACPSGVETPAVAAENPAVPKPKAAPGGEESVAELEPSPELQSALDEAIKSYEKLEQKKKQPKEEVPKQSEEELKLKVEILDLKHKLRALETEIEKKAKEVKQNYDQGMILKNQFDAYKARIMKEKSESFNYGFEPVLKEMLAVVDNFERALEHAKKPEDFDSMKEGVGLILRQVMQFLEKYGVKPIHALNQVFDPNFHEAMTQVESAEHPNNTVVQVHSKGYMLKDRLLRPSMVTISRNPNEPKTSGSTAEPAPEGENHEQKIQSDDKMPEGNSSESKKMGGM
jgi:molecular chaperone GrpE